MKRVLFIASLTAFFGSVALAEGKGTKLPLLPLLGAYPTPMNIVFPNLLTSAASNPAALGRYPKVNALAVAYSPKLSNSTQQYFAGFATSKKGLGFNLGLLGRESFGSATHSVFGGVGYGFDQVAIGLGVRESNFVGGFDPSIDLGLTIGESTGVSGALTLYNLAGSSQMAVGVGYAKSKSFTIEADVRLPTFDNLGGAYLITIAANIAVDPLAFHFATHYNTGFGGSNSHTLGVSFWTGESFNLQAQFNSSNTWTAGLIFAF